MMEGVKQAGARAAEVDWKWQLVGPVVSTIGVPVFFMWASFSPLGWVHGVLQEVSSTYQQVLTRVQLHGERICMLQGEKYELTLLNSGAENEAYWTDWSRRAQLWQEYLQTMLFSDIGMSFVPQLGLFSGAVMCASRLRKPGGRAAAQILDETKPDLAVGADFGKAIEDNWTIMYSMGASGMLIGTMVMLSQMRHLGGRLGELYACMEELAMQRDTDNKNLFEDKGPVVSFTGVRVVTPSKNTLLKDLTFEVPEGHTLLISGHNGAGKSSIIRCLCNLWQAKDGVIARPGGAIQAEENVILHEEIYYLPQKPVSVLGSLSDQLTYPLRVANGLPEPELRRWLRYVDLEYLVDRHTHTNQASLDAVLDQGVDTEKNLRDWEEMLSLGEQQALSIARLLYHHPRFAILDECTSAISKVLERRLFELTRELGMACITITHRPALQEHHMRALRLTGTLEEDDKGWQIEDLANKGSLLSVIRKPCADMEEAHARITAHLASKQESGQAPVSASTKVFLQSNGIGSAQAEHSAPADVEAMVRKRWPSSWQRMVGVVRLGILNQDQAKSVGRQCAIMALMLCGRATIHWEMWIHLATGMGRGLTGNYDGVFACIFANVLLFPLYGYFDFFMKKRSQKLALQLWLNAKRSLHTRALGTGAFLRVMRPNDPEVPHVENPVQRINEVRGVMDHLEGLTENLLKVLSMAAFTLPMLVRGGGFGTVAVLGGSFAVFGACQALAPDWKKIEQKMQKYETRFQVLHTRLRHIAEPVAFSGGGGAERRVIEPLFEDIADFRKKTLKDEFLYNWVMSLFSSYDLLPMGVQRLLSTFFARRNLPDASNGVSPRLAQTGLLYDRCISFSQRAEMRLVTFLPEWRRLDGKFLRLLELPIAFDAVDRAGGEASAAPISDSTALEPGNEIAVTGLDLMTPRGVRLATGVAFKLEEGSPLLVTGPNASGKTLMGCMLLGLLPIAGAEAQVSLPGCVKGCRPPLAALMTAPQRVYLPLGTLGDQVCYPYKYKPSADGEEEKVMLRALGASGIENLFKREKRGWLARRVWEDTLSGGEQQRIVLARIFFRKPRFALLDECTSMVAAAAEDGLYRTLSAEFGVTPLTLTQRLFMADLYKNELRLGLPTPEGWQLASTAAPSV